MEPFNSYANSYKEIWNLIRDNENQFGIPRHVVIKTWTPNPDEKDSFKGPFVFLNPRDYENVNVFT